MSIYKFNVVKIIIVFNFITRNILKALLSHQKIPVVMRLLNQGFNSDVKCFL